MNAFQPTPPPSSSRRVSPRIRRQKRRNPYQAVVSETMVKCGVNLLLAAVAVSALVRLLPYNMGQQAKLQELQTEVSGLENRVDQLQADLSRQFDPQQAVSVMQEQSIRVDPRQRQVVWLDPHAAPPARQPDHDDASPTGEDVQPQPDF